ncbi:MAG: CinA family nicotinamide mononucleotide deamidase-related protein [Planctomycetota bacterium]|jgi:nicotinamide-nucleotide amidase
MRSAGLLSVGDELVLGTKLDTNAMWIASALADCGVQVVEHRTLPDDREVIATALRDLAATCDVIIVTGGLGPTEDDVTREGLADVVAPGADLVEDEEAVAHLRRCFAGRVMPDANLRQALRPPETRMVPNPRGTAMGVAAVLDGTHIALLPGPPHEMRGMFEGHVLPLLETDDARLVSRTIRAVGIGESDGAERLGDILARGREPLVGITASAGVLSAIVRGWGEAARSAVDATARTIEERWAPYVFSNDGSSLAESLVQLFRERGWSLCTAESCTGGLVSGALVAVPGASAVLRGGWVTYANDAKADWLGVPRALIDEHGAVSAQVAEAMVRGALERSGADWAISTTGVAGPGGGTPDKPVGTVEIGVGCRDGAVQSRRFWFRGERAIVRSRSVTLGLQLLRMAALGVPTDVPMLWSPAHRPVEPRA